MKAQEDQEFLETLQESKDRNGGEDLERDLNEAKSIIIDCLIISYIKVCSSSYVMGLIFAFLFRSL